MKRHSDQPPKSIFVVISLGALIAFTIVIIEIILGADVYGLQLLGIPYKMLTPIITFTFIIVTILGYKGIIRKVVLEIQKYGKNKIIKTSISIIVIQLFIASICYWIYYDNPKLYVLGEEIEKRYMEISHSTFEEKIKTNKDLKNEIDSNIKILKYLSDPTTSWKGNSGLLRVNDSLLVTFFYPTPCPKCDDIMLMEVYTKNSLKNLGVFYSKPLPFREAIEFHLSELTERQSKINNNLNQLLLDAYGNPFRWSYLHFLSYYFSGQIVPMSKLLIIMGGIKVVLWFLFTLVVSSPIWANGSKIDL